MSNITISDIIITPDTQSFLHELKKQEIGDVLGGWYVRLLWGAIEFGSGDKC